MSLDRSRKQDLVLACATPDAVDQVVDFVDQRLDQWLNFCRKKFEQLAQTDGARLLVFRGKDQRGLFPALAAGLHILHLRFDRGGQVENGGRVSAQKIGLLVFEKPEQSAIFLQLVAQAFSDCFPRCAHDGDFSVRGFKDVLR